MGPIKDGVDYEIEVKGSEKLDAAAKKVDKFNESVSKSEKSNSKAALAYKKASDEFDGLTDSTNRSADATDYATDRQKNYFAHIARTTIQSALINKAFLGLTDAIGQAAKQVDLLENFPAAMGALGISSKDAAVGLDKLREYVIGVGGDLTQASAAVARFAQVNRDIKGSVAIYAGVNNALLAGGQSALAQQQSLEQLVQGYSRGRFEGEEFKSMMTSMNLALGETARSLKLASPQALQKALADGEISMNQFISALARVSTESGPVANAAIANMQGIGFATALLRNTMVNGLTAIYQAVGRQNIVAVFSLITQTIQVLVSWAVTLINTLISLFNFLSGLFGGPQLNTLAKDTGAVAGNLETGAGAADDLGKGLGGAGKAAKKLNKQLASFDKMNVLQNKDANTGGGGSGGGAGAGGAGGLDPGAMKGLDDIFNKLKGRIQEAGLAAKILAGVLTGLAANNLLGKIFGTTPLQAFRESLKKLTTDAHKASKSVSSVGDSAKKSAKEGSKLPKILAIPKNPIVLATLAILALATGLTWLYQNNKDFKKGFDETWGPISDVLKNVWEWLSIKIVGAIKYLADIIPGVPDIDIKINGMEGLGGLVGILTGGLVIAAGVAAAIFVTSWVVGFATTLIEGGIWVTKMTTTLLKPSARLVSAWLTAKAQVIGVWAKLTAESMIRASIVTANWVKTAAGVATKWATVKVKILAEWATLATKSVVEAGKVVISWTATAVATAKKWATKAGEIVITWGGLAIKSAKKAGEVAVAWAATAIGFVSSWVSRTAIVVAIWVSLAAQSIIRAAIVGAAWVSSAVAAGAAWVVANAAILGLWGILIAAIIGAVVLIIKNWDKIKIFFINLWNKIKEIFSKAPEWFGQKFQEAKDNITKIFSAIGGWFGDRWSDIKSALSAVGTWIGDKFKSGWTTISNTFSGIGKWFGDKWTAIKSSLSTVNTWLGNKFKSGWDAIKKVFDNPGAFFKTVWTKIKNVFSGIGSKIGGAVGGAFKTAINGVLGTVENVVNGFVDKINGVIGIINKIPGVSLPNVPRVNLPRLAHGGVVDQATALVAGEAGSEAIVPLENNTEWVNKVASLLNNARGGDGQPVQIIVQIGEEQIINKVINLINERSDMTGRNMVRV